MLHLTTTRLSYKMTALIYNPAAAKTVTKFHFPHSHQHMLYYYYFSYFWNKRNTFVNNWVTFKYIWIIFLFTYFAKFSVLYSRIYEFLVSYIILFFFFWCVLGILKLYDMFHFIIFMVYFISKILIIFKFIFLHSLRLHLVILYLYLTILISDVLVGIQTHFYFIFKVTCCLMFLVIFNAEFIVTS